MRKVLDLIGAQLGWGARYHEAAFGPQALQTFGLINKLVLQDNNKEITWQMLMPEIPFSTEITQLNLEDRMIQVTQFNKKLAHEVMNSCQKGHFPIILGGDHSIAMGTWSGVTAALKAPLAFGLIWVDAHMDAHTMQTTPSQALHGMPLAALLGYGEPSFTDLCSFGAKLDPRHVVLIGVRSFESGEADLLKKLQVKIYFMEEVKSRGFSVVWDEAIQRVTHQTKGFGISMDLDAFDPKVAPGTGTPEPGGLAKEDVLNALKKIRTLPGFKAFEIAEFDPTRDKQNMTAKLVQEIIQSIL